MHLRKSLTKVKARSVHNFYTAEKKWRIEKCDVKIGSYLSCYFAGNFLSAIELLKKSL